MGFVILFHCEECYFNPHMHKMSPLQGLKNYFWQPILLEKYQNGQIPRVSDKKHIILPEVQELTRIYEFCSYLV